MLVFLTVAEVLISVACVVCLFYSCKACERLEQMCKNGIIAANAEKDATTGNERKKYASLEARYNELYKQYQEVTEKYQRLAKEKSVLDGEKWSVREENRRLSAKLERSERREQIFRQHAMRMADMLVTARPTLALLEEKPPMLEMLLRVAQDTADLVQPLNKTGLNNRICNALRRRVETADLVGLMALSDHELATIRGLGDVSLREVQDFLKKHGEVFIEEEEDPTEDDDIYGEEE